MSRVAIVFLQKLQEHTRINPTRQSVAGMKNDGFVTFDDVNVWEGNPASFFGVENIPLSYRGSLNISEKLE